MKLLPQSKTKNFFIDNVNIEVQGNTRTIAPEENCRRLGLGFGLQLGLVLGLGVIFLGGIYPKTLREYNINIQK